VSLHPNALLPCPSSSARRRHAAHGRVCPVCDSTPSVDDPACLQQRITDVESSNADLHRQVAALADWAQIADDNTTLSAQLADVEQVFAVWLRSPTIRREAVELAYRRIFPSSQEVAA
jgi:hypothetical protein